MRRGRISTLLAFTEGLKDRGERVEPKPMLPSMAMWVQLRGSSCAAFIVWSQHKKFRERGECDFSISNEKLTPKWFQIGIAFLEQRKGWQVVNTLRVNGERHYRVIWKGKRYEN